MKNILHSLSVISIVSLWLCSMTANAAIVEGLYEAEISVPNQSKKVRAKAMGQGLAEVFAKVSGNPDVAALEPVKQAMDQAGRYLQQFLYRRPAEIKNADPNARKNTQILWLRFDEQSINKILRENSLPVWGRTRPATLVWLAIDQDGGRYMLGSDSREELALMLKFQAKRLGLALVLPLLDLQDQRLVNFSDVWGGFRDPIENASQRYQAEAILVGRMSLSRSDVWTAKWSLYEGNEPLSWESQGKYAEEIIKLSLAQVTNTLASRYAVVLDGDSSGEMQISVYGIHTLEQLVRVSDYLQSLQPVTSVQPVKVAPDNARYRVSIRGNPDGLVRIIALGNVLKSDPTANQAVSNPNDPSGFVFGATNSSSNFNRDDNSEYMYRLMP